MDAVETAEPTEHETAILESDDPPAGGLLVEELLVEEVSIDGMCGVY